MLPTVLLLPWMTCEALAKSRPYNEPWIRPALSPWKKSASEPDVTMHAVLMFLLVFGLVWNTCFWCSPYLGSIPCGVILRGGCSVDLKGA